MENDMREDAALKLVADHRAGIRRPLTPGCIHITLSAREPAEPEQPMPAVSEAITAEWRSVKTGRDGVPYELISGMRDAAIPGLAALATYGLYCTDNVSASLAVAIIVPMALITVAALAWPWLRR